MKYLRPFVFIALFFAAASCGSKNPDSPDDGDNGDGTTLANGSMSGSISGASSFNATAIGVTYIPGAPATLIVAGADNQGRSIGFGLFASNTGTYNVNDPNAFPIFLIIIGAAQWQADAFLYFGSGSLSITTYTANHAVGSWNFTANPVPGTGATGTKQSSGNFNVTY